MSAANDERWVEVRKKLAEILQQGPWIGPSVEALEGYAEVVQAKLHKTAEKTEHTSAAFARDLGDLHALAMSLQSAEGDAIAIKIRGLLGELQYHDVIKQEVEDIANSLGKVVGYLRSIGWDDMEEGLRTLPEALEGLVPRNDLDARDVEDDGPAIELF